MTDQPKKFTVERSKWLRGGESVLLDHQARMCCLGFVSLQCGVPPIELLAVGCPDSLPYSARDRLRGLLIAHGGGQLTRLTQRAIEINDNSEIDDATREAQLSALFSKHGSEMEFVP